MPAGLDEALARLGTFRSTSARLFDIDVGEVPLAGPALESEVVSFTDQVARESGALVAKHRAVDADLFVVALDDILYPHEERAAAHREQDHLLARRHELVALAPVGVLARRIVPLVQRERARVVLVTRQPVAVDHRGTFPCRMATMSSQSAGRQMPHSLCR